MERFGSGGEREIDVLGMNFIEEVDVAPQLVFILLLKKGLKIMDLETVKGLMDITKVAMHFRKDNACLASVTRV